jgi:hypothetical protein
MFTSGLVLLSDIENKIVVLNWKIMINRIREQVNNSKLVLLATCITPVSALGLSFDPEN